MQVTIDVTSDEAETILFALAMRSKQSRLSELRADEAVDLSRRLNDTFEKSFGWTPWDRTSANRKPIKRVSIACYDYPPTE